MTPKEGSPLIRIESFDDMYRRGRDFGVDEAIIAEIEGEMGNSIHNLEVFQSRGGSVFERFFEDKKYENDVATPAVALELILLFLPKEFANELQALTVHFDELKERIGQIDSPRSSDSEALGIVARRIFYCTILFSDLLRDKAVKITRMEQGKTLFLSSEAFIQSHASNDLRPLENTAEFPAGTRMSFFCIIGRNYDRVRGTVEQDAYLEHLSLLLFRETFAAFSLRETLIHFPESLWEDWIASGENRSKILDENTEVGKIFRSIWESVPVEFRPRAVREVLDPTWVVEGEKERVSHNTMSVLTEDDRKNASRKLAEELNMEVGTQQALDDFFTEEREGQWAKLKVSLRLLQKQPKGLNMVLFEHQEVLEPLRFFLIFLPAKYRKELEEFAPLFQEIKESIRVVDFRHGETALERVSPDAFEEFDKVTYYPQQNSEGFSNEDNKELKRIAFAASLEFWARVRYLFPIMGEVIEKDQVELDIVDREGAISYATLKIKSPLEEIRETYLGGDVPNIPVGDLFSLYFVLAQDYNKRPEKKTAFLAQLNILLYRESTAALSMARYFTKLPEELWRDWLGVYANSLLDKNSEVRKVFVSLWEGVRQTELPHPVKIMLKAMGEEMRRSEKEISPLPPLDFSAMVDGTMPFPNLLGQRSGVGMRGEGMAPKRSDLLDEKQFSRDTEEFLSSSGGNLERNTELLFRLAPRYKEIIKRGKDENKKAIFIAQLSLILSGEGERSPLLRRDELQALPNRLWNDWAEKNPDIFTNKNLYFRALVLLLWKDITEDRIPRDLRKLFSRAPEDQKIIPQRREAPVPQKTISPASPSSKERGAMPLSVKAPETKEYETYPAPVLEQNFQTGDPQIRITNFPRGENSAPPLLLMRLRKVGEGMLKGVGHGAYYLPVDGEGVCSVPQEVVLLMKQNKTYTATFSMVPRKGGAMPPVEEGTRVDFVWNQRENIPHPVIQTLPTTETQFSEKIVPPVSVVKSVPAAKKEEPPKESQELTFQDKADFLLEGLNEFDGDWEDIIEVDEHPSLDKEDSKKIFRFHFTERFLSENTLIDDGFPAITILFGTFRRVGEPEYLRISEPVFAHEKLQTEIIKIATRVLSDHEVAAWEKELKEGKDDDFYENGIKALASIFKEYMHLSSLEDENDPNRVGTKDFFKNPPFFSGKIGRMQTDVLRNAKTHFSNKLKPFGVCLEWKEEGVLSLDILKKYRVSFSWKEGRPKAFCEPSASVLSRETQKKLEKFTWMVLQGFFGSILLAPVKILRKKFEHHRGRPEHRRDAWKRIVEGKARLPIYDEYEETLIGIEEGDGSEGEGRRGKAEASENEFVVVQDSKILFPRNGIDEGFSLSADSERYNKFRKFLIPERNKKYLVARIISTIRHILRAGEEGYEGAVKYRDKEQIHCRATQKLLREILPLIGQDLNMLAGIGNGNGHGGKNGHKKGNGFECNGNGERVRDLLNISLQIEGKHWIDYLVDRMEQEKIPVGVQREIVARFDVLEEEAVIGQWEGTEDYESIDPGKIRKHPRFFT